MTVQTTGNVAIGTGNGVADEFDFGFKVLDETHLVVQRRVRDTGEIDLTYTTGDYTVSGVGEDSGSITLTDGPLSADYDIIISRVVPHKQELDIINQGGFYPDTTEEQLDLIVMQIQQVEEQVGRSLKVGKGDSVDDLVGAAGRAGYYLAFDAEGDPSLASGTGADSALRTDLAASTGATLSGFKRTGAATATRTIKSKLEDIPSLLDWSNVDPDSPDNSAAIQAALDEVHDAGGNKILVPEGTFIGNYELRHQVSLVGAGRGRTVFEPFSNAPVFSTPDGESTNNILLADFTIAGDDTMNAQDGIHLETTGANWVDNIRLQNLHIFNCGRDGVRLRGTSSAGPFVQRVYMDNVESHLNKKRNLNILGCVLETTIAHCSLCLGLDTVADASSVYIGEDSGSVPGRVLILGGIYSNQAPNSIGNRSPAIRVAGVQGLTILGAGFEFCDPAIFLDDSVFNRNVAIWNNDINIIDATDNGILVTKCKRLSIRNNAFACTGGMTSAITLAAGAGSDTPNPDIQFNRDVGGVTTMLTDSTGHTQAIASGAANMYRKVMGLSPESGITDDLTHLYDEDGGTGGLVRGDEVMIFAQANTVVVKHGTGNIFLAGAADFSISGTKALTVKWTGGAWLEVGRCS